MATLSLIKSCCRSLFVAVAILFIINQTVLILRSPVDHAAVQRAVPVEGAQADTSPSKNPWLLFANKSGCGRPAVPYRLDARRTIPLPTTALLSAQGSGNTWLRWLIERLTGICTGSLYKERLMKSSAGFKCETASASNGMSIVQKTHYIEQISTDRILLLVRNPMDAIVSDYHRVCTAGNHTGEAGDTSFSGPGVTSSLKNSYMYLSVLKWREYSAAYGIVEWNGFVITRSGEWLDQILKALNRATELHVVFYENLITNLVEELQPLATFLRVYVSPERLECVYQNQQGKMRRQSKGKGRGYYNPFNLDLISLVLTRAVTAFQAQGIPNIPAEYLNISSQVQAKLSGTN